MTPKERHRLTELDSWIAKGPACSAHQTSIRNGHPTLLHAGWALRPMVTCCGMRLALKRPHPADRLILETRRG